ncbi:transcription factor bHLH68-like isoform X1 [Primulina huaijiensis]|uniref:transcription factor bHLH68-like isoform X1 n=1 Tax=Primulina huaijiensis TaxID=1492673 RepID=UPI003CC736CE
MMAGNPNWWSMNGMHPQFSQFVYGSNISSLSSTPSESDHHPEQDFPVRSWSQLLLGGLSGNEQENRFGGSLFQQQKKLENWEDQVLNLNSTFTRDCAINLDVKQEVSQTNSCGGGQLFPEHLDYDNFQANSSQTSNSNWGHHQVMPVSSPTSCITNLSNSLLNFSGGKGSSAAATEGKNHRHNQEHSSECNSTGTGGVSKKARIQQSSSQPALKVRKEKLGDRITALHQFVSPFGKTDTASVLSEAIGYIRFLQSQIEALSSPYMRNTPGNSSHHCVQERNCLYREEPSQESQGRGGQKDLRKRGLCLVPISCTQHVGNDNIIGADYWAPPPPALGGGF